MKLKFWLAASALPVLAIGCQTIPDEAVEIKNAEKAVDAAENRDLDDLMPGVMELAHMQLDESKDLWREADRRAEDSQDESQDLRQDARAKASSAESLARSALAISDRLDAWNKDPREFVRMNDLAAGRETQAPAPVASEPEEPKTKGLTGEQLLQGLPVAFFETGKADLTSAAEERVDQLVSFMKDNDETIITLAGFADPRGSEEFNQELSKKRGEVVAKRLKDAGIDESRIKVTAGGESGSEEENLAALQLERRVEAHIEEGTAH